MDKQAGFFGDIVDKVKDFFSRDIDEGFEYQEEQPIEERQQVVDDLSNVAPPIEESVDPAEQVPGDAVQNRFIDEKSIIEVDEPEEDTGMVNVNNYRLHLPSDTSPSDPGDPGDDPNDYYLGNLRARLGDPKVDHSYPVLKYLESLGYDNVNFVIHSEHKEQDICDEVKDANPWDLSGILRSAESDSDAKGYVVAPIFHLAHPGCKSYFHVQPPNTIDEIPNSAPGLHMWDDEEKIIEEKRELLMQLPPVNVDRYTLAPHMFKAMPVEGTNEDNSANRNVPDYLDTRVQDLLDDSEGQNSQSSVNNDNIKKADATWVEDVKPVKIIGNTFIKQKGGAIQFVMKEFEGLQGETYNKLARVFLTDLEREIIVPINRLKKIELKPTNDKPNVGSFVMVAEDSMGIYMGKFEKGCLVYSQEFDGFVWVDEWNLMTLKTSEMK